MSSPRLVRRWMSQWPILSLVGLLSMAMVGCGSTSADYVASQHGYAVTRGRLVRVDGLVSESLVHLSDGVAFQIDSRTCKVAVEFDDGTRRVLELGGEDVLVCGVDADYVLQPAQSSSQTPASDALPK